MTRHWFWPWQIGQFCYIRYRQFWMWYFLLRTLWKELQKTFFENISYCKAMPKPKPQKGLTVCRPTSQPEINESLKKVSVSTTFAKSRKVSVSKNLKLQSRESLERFENLQSRKVLVSKKQKIWVSKKSQSRKFSLNSLGDY